MLRSCFDLNFLLSEKCAYLHLHSKHRIGETNVMIRDNVKTFSLEIRVGFHGHLYN